jgi:hypothetical protein
MLRGEGQTFLVLLHEPQEVQPWRVMSASPVLQTGFILTQQRQLFYRGDRAVTRAETQKRNMFPTCWQQFI